MSFDILNIEEIDFSKINFTKKDENKDIVRINYSYDSGNNDKIRIATPWVDLLEINNYFCLLSLKVMSNEPKMHSIYEFIKNFDKHVIESCKKYNWFNSNDFSK